MKEKTVRKKRTVFCNFYATYAPESEMAGYAGMRRGTANTWVITSQHCIDFGGMLSAFCAAFPEISVNIVQGGTQDLMQQLLDRKLDLAFSNRPPTGLPSGLDFLKLDEDVYHLAVPTDIRAPTVAMIVRFVPGIVTASIFDLAFSCGMHQTAPSTTR